MTEEQRYQGVQADIKRLMQQATNDRSPGGVVGFGAALLAAKLHVINEQGRGKVSPEEVSGNGKQKQNPDI